MMPERGKLSGWPGLLVARISSIIGFRAEGTPSSPRFHVFPLCAVREGVREGCFKCGMRSASQVSLEDAFLQLR